MPYESLSQRLSHVDLLAGLSPQARDDIISAGSTFTTNPGETIVEQGHKDVGLRLILNGSATVEVNGVEVATLNPGDYFGEISMIDRKPRSATVRAGSDGLRTFAVSALSFEPILAKHPEVARVLLVALCERLRSLEASLGRPSTS
jgi:CRP-like cAMP-binding protein